MKAVVRNGNSILTTNCVYYKYPNGSNGRYISGLEWDLLKVVYDLMNMTIDHVPTPQKFELGKGWSGNLIMALVQKET